MSKYETLLSSLRDRGEGSMKCFGNSMLPIIESGSTCHFEVRDSYLVGDVVFCRVKGRVIDAHKITALGDRGYMISNNRGYDNGWTKTVYGKVVRVTSPSGATKDLK